MHTVKLKIEDHIYAHIMFLLQNLNTKGLEIVEEKPLPHQPNTKESIKELFAHKSIPLFESIDDPLQWQKEQRDEW
jgi:hypothetical protein